MRSTITVEDAVSTLERSLMPSVLTEGSDDYRVLRKVEVSLSDVGVDFLPVGDKWSVLEVWSRILPERRRSVMAVVDCDLWLFFGIPPRYQHEGIICTLGYSIENDIFLDGNLLALCSAAEETAFKAEVSVIASWYAREVRRALDQQPYCLSTHVNAVIETGDISSSLSPDEKALKMIVQNNFVQTVRGKNLLQLLVRQLARPGRYAKFGYKQLYEVGSLNIGEIIGSYEARIRNYMS